MRSRATQGAPRALGLAAALGWAFTCGAAQAADPAGEAAPTLEEQELGPELGTKRPAAPDQRAGHFLIQGRFGLEAPFGSIATSVPASSVVSSGAAFGASVGLGLSRVTVLEASGSYASLPGGSRCDACSGTSLDLGLGLVYHLAQGIAFDPWIRYGVGYRRSTFAGTTRTDLGLRTFPDVAFQGVDVARIAFGGDFYPVPAFGFGPFLELDAGTYVVRPQGGFGQTTYGFFQVGLRLALDPMPRAGTATSAAQARRVGDTARAPAAGTTWGRAR